MKTLNLVAVLGASLLLATASFAQKPQTPPAQQPVVKTNTTTAHHTMNTDVKKGAASTPVATKAEATTPDKAKAEQKASINTKSKAKKHNTKKPEATKTETKGKK